MMQHRFWFDIALGLVLGLVPASLLGVVLDRDGVMQSVFVAVGSVMGSAARCVRFPRQNRACARSPGIFRSAAYKLGHHRLV